VQINCGASDFLSSRTCPRTFSLDHQNARDWNNLALVYVAAECKSTKYEI